MIIDEIKINYEVYNNMTRAKQLYRGMDSRLTRPLESDCGFWWLDIRCDAEWDRKARDGIPMFPPHLQGNVSITGFHIRPIEHNLSQEIFDSICLEMAGAFPRLLDSKLRSNEQNKL